VSAYHKNALPTGYTIAEYRIDAVLGHGGFGITYLAHDTSLGAQVAIKEFLPHDIAARDEKSGAILPNPTRGAVRDYQWGLKNFVKEARALARFKHPHIVRVLRFLESNGTAYTVMEYEKGHTLAEYLKKHGPTIDETTLLRIFIPILNGLHAVHEAHMLHLDIKPANIYLREDGSPMLIDFGSARQAITATTQTQRIALTRGYAPMEQYPEKGKPGPWTDIYGIGATMYRCVMGRNPIESLDRYRAVLDYKVDPMTPATKTKAGPYRENILECIDWAMQIYPKDRPQSAREFQDALMGSRRRAVPTVTVNVPTNRNGATSANLRPPALPLPLGWIIGLVLLAVAGGAIYYLWPELQKKWRTIERELAQHERSVRTPAPKPDAPRPAPVKPSASKPSVDSVPKSKGPPTISSGTSSKAAIPSVLVRTLAGHSDWVQSVAFAPNGRWLASGSNDKTVKVWDVSKGALVGTLHGHGYAINAIAISPDGKWIASGGVDGTVRLWALATGRQKGALRGLGYAIYAVAFSPDGRRLVAGGKDRSVFVWDLESGQRQHTLEGHEGDIFTVAISPDGQYLASAGADQKIIVWDLARGERRYELPGHRDSVLSLAFSPDGKFLASGGAAHTIRLWDMETGAHIRTLNAVDGAILSLVFGRDGSWLAAGVSDGTVRIIDAGNGQVLQTLRGHGDIVQALALSPDGGLLASGSRDHSVKLWRALP